MPQPVPVSRLGLRQANIYAIRPTASFVQKLIVLISFQCLPKTMFHCITSSSGHKSALPLGPHAIYLKPVHT